MSRERPNAAPPCATMPTQRSSVSAVLALQSFRSAGGTSSRVLAAGVPRPSAPWHDLHHAWNSAPPLSRGAWVASNSATTGASVTEGERYAWRPSEFGERWRLDSGAQHAILSRRSTRAPGRAERTARGRPSRDAPALHIDPRAVLHPTLVRGVPIDRKSTRLNSSHSQISYAVFCLKKKKSEAVRHRATGLCPYNASPSR